MTEAEIVHLGIPFGRVTNVLVLKGKNQVRLLFFLLIFPMSETTRLVHHDYLNRINLIFCVMQAFLEMADEGAAISMVNYFSSGTSAQLRGRNVFVQYSNHVALKTDQSHSNAVGFYLFILFIVN